ncbi:Roadblock/LC7 domain-containing protein [Thermomonospora echinospora]|uniref:Roadblock/LC7 domain-containing protein n=1 Tax=Thermomonospora echinospora TaxID=1992 RepID=A0A1H6DRU2_9ACTN|nr:roadblock/LC7 domain-containing protein [Thermomonospora echinospora]SEG87999.1 Roadblock/LC7 domain-containing protein [Thermomonospora echinospora]
MTEISSRTGGGIGRAPEDNGWMLEGLELPGVRHAVVCSRDGLPLAWSASTERWQAEHLSAACAGFAQLGDGLAAALTGASGSRAADAPAEAAGGQAVPVESVQEQFMKYPDAVLFVRGAAHNTVLAVWADKSIDPALVARQMQRQVDWIGRGMNAPARTGRS